MLFSEIYTVEKNVYFFFFLLYACGGYEFELLVETANWDSIDSFSVAPINKKHHQHKLPQYNVHRTSFNETFHEMVAISYYSRIFFRVKLNYVKSFSLTTYLK